MTPLQQILSTILSSVQKLLIDERLGQDVQAPDYDDAPYLQSQFHVVFPNAYDADKNRNPYQGTPGVNATYPLTETETLDLQDVRILQFIQLGFIPYEDIEKITGPSLFVANATDRRRVDAADTTLNQVEEIIPINFRLVTKQPALHTLGETNIVVVDKVLSGLKYVLDPRTFTNLRFERRGYKSDTVIRDIEFVQSLNLEEFLTPYEVTDYLFSLSVREQRSR